MTLNYYFFQETQFATATFNDNIAYLTVPNNFFTKNFTDNTVGIGNSMDQKMYN